MPLKSKIKSKKKRIFYFTFMRMLLFLGATMNVLWLTRGVASSESYCANTAEAHRSGHSNTFLYFSLLKQSKIRPCPERKACEKMAKTKCNREKRQVKIFENLFTDVKFINFLPLNHFLMMFIRNCQQT